MAFFDFLRARFGAPEAPRGPAPQASSGITFSSLTDPELEAYIRGRGGAQTLSVSDAMRNPAVARACELISGAVAMLPLAMMQKGRDGARSPVETHSLYRLFMYRPNSWQTAFQFKQQMQHWALLHGNAVAEIVRLGNRIIAINPIEPHRVKIDQMRDYSLLYQITRADQSYAELTSRDVLHIRGPSENGYRGISKVQQAADVISLGLQSQRASARIFENGMMVGGALQIDKALSQEAFERLRASMSERTGADNSGKWMILEEGLKATPFEQTAADSQMVEQRAAMVEDIARIFGVPRPLMGVDETAWGSGIEQLAILFVRFALMPWFKAWEDAITVACLQPSEWGVIYPDFDEQELLRGTLKDQADFFAKASGAGGHQPWMTANEIRDVSGMGPLPGGDVLVRATDRTTP